MEKGTANMDSINKNMKKEMVDFVSFYRRFNNIAGKQSFSTLYTAINVLAGHYTSYGTKFPVPEKRRKRLYQEYAEIEKNIKKSRWGAGAWCWSVVAFPRTTLSRFMPTLISSEARVVLVRRWAGVDFAATQFDSAA
jgi:hypothetical protein